MAIQVNTNPVPPSGPLSFSTLRQKLKETSSGSVSLGELYRNGPYVPNTSSSQNVPTSGAISVGGFYSVNVSASAIITGVEQNLNASSIFGADYTTALRKTITVNGYIISQNTNPAMTLPAGAGSVVTINLTSGGIFGAAGGGGGGQYYYYYDCSYTRSDGGGGPGYDCNNACNNSGFGYCGSGCYSSPVYGGSYNSQIVGYEYYCNNCFTFISQSCLGSAGPFGGGQGYTALRLLSSAAILGTGALIYGGGGGGGGGGLGGTEGSGGRNNRGYSCGFFGWQYCESCDGGVGGGNDLGGNGGNGGTGAGYNFNGVSLNAIGPTGGAGGVNPNNGGGTGGTGGTGGNWGASGNTGDPGSSGATGPGGNCAGGGGGSGGSGGAGGGPSGNSIEGWNRVTTITSSGILAGPVVNN
jgi:hypothetical protein